MTKSKKIMTLGIIFTFMLLFTSKVNAAETFSTNDGIVASKIVEGTNGNIEFSFSNIPLDAQSTYEWGISKTNLKEEVTKWYALNDFNGTNKTAKVNLLVSEKEVLSVLRTTDEAYLYIKDSKAGTFVVDALKVDLTLPPYHACQLYETERGRTFFIGGIGSSGYPQYNGAVYQIKNVSYKFMKVTDENLLDKYNQAMKNNTSIEEVFNINAKDIEKITGWEACTETIKYSEDKYYNTEIEKERLPQDDGLYILYMKAKDSDSKTVYGYRTWPSGLKEVPVGGNNNNTTGSGNNGSTGGTQGGQGTSTNKGNTTIAGKTDTTTAKQILPNTGITKIIILLIAVLGIAGMIGYIKYKNIPIK